MNYIERNETYEKIYSVVYDKKRLTDILEELKNYSYYTIESSSIESVNTHSQMDKSENKRISNLFYASKRHLNAKLHKRTIKYHKENGREYYTFNYSYEKLPDLYDYIDLIINNKNILLYDRLFRKKVETRIGYYDFLYLAANKDQLLLEGLLNYANSTELTNHSSKKIGKDHYNYEGLNELYKETLNCFKFNLTEEHLKNLKMRKHLKNTNK